MQEGPGSTGAGLHAQVGWAVTSLLLVTVLSAGNGSLLDLALQNVDGGGNDIVLDEIGTNDMRISTMGPDANTFFRPFEPAIAFNAAENLYLAVWRSDDDRDGQLPGEQEIFGQLIDGDGNQVGPDDFRISLQGGTLGSDAVDTSDPAVAWNATDNEFLVVWSGGSASATDDEIYLQRIEGSSGTLLGVNQRISVNGPEADGNYRAVHPDVAWNATDNQYLVVWSGEPLINEEFEIYGQRLDNTAAQIGADDFRISEMGPNGNAGYDAEHPSVVWNAVDNEYLVVWSGDDDSAPLSLDENEIFGQRLSRLGAEIGSDDFRISDMGPDGNSGFDALRPAVAYNSTGNQYLVVWYGDDDLFPGVLDEFEVFGQRLDPLGTEIGANDFRISSMGPATNTSYAGLDPAIRWNPADNEYLVVWRGDHDQFPLVEGEDEIFAQRLDPAGTLLDSMLRLSDMGPDSSLFYDARNPALVYNPVFNEFGVVFEGDDGVDNEWEIRLQLWGSVTPADSDGDGVRDGFDACPGHDDRLDSDGDDVADGCDLCWGFDDADDLDLDTVPDGCDVCAGVDDKLDSDSDGVTFCLGDCDDANPLRFPGNYESCDGVDNDCDGFTGAGEIDADGDGFRVCDGDCDDSNPLRIPNLTFYLDADGDGFGNPVLPTSSCFPPAFYVTDNSDCDDFRPDRFPGNPEVCDGLDNDCDTAVDEDVMQSFHRDSDGDGFGDPLTVALACAAPAGFVSDGSDCDDSNPEHAPGNTYYLDADGDGYGNPTLPTTSCLPPAFYVKDGTDCDDFRSQRFPGNLETCDGLDNDCDGIIPLDERDNDGDGQAACAGDCNDFNIAVRSTAEETCDGLDNNCDGTLDEGFDLDSDGVPDCVDNCSEMSNTDQIDFDLDGRGDSCESGGALADIDRSEFVDGRDLTLLAISFGAGCTEAGYNSAADLNRDCSIDGLDLALLAQYFGDPVGSS